MLPISSGDVLIGASLSRNTRKQRAVADAQLTADTFAARWGPLRRARPKGETRRGKSAHGGKSVPGAGCSLLRGVAVGSEPGAVLCGAMLCGAVRLAAALPPRGGPGAGKAAPLPGDGGVAAGSAGLRWLRAAPGRAGAAPSALLAPLPWRSLLEKAPPHGTDGERGFNQLCRALRGAAGLRWAAG